MPSSSPIRTGYLVLYNALSAAAWSVVLYHTIHAWRNKGWAAVFFEVGEWTRWTQTAAAMEVVHSLVGIVRAPFVTTVMQVASRFLLVWGIVYPYPFITSAPFYATMLLAWSATEVIRYSFFATSLLGLCPSFLLFLRYNTFFILYPLGIFSECSLIWITTKIPQVASAAYDRYFLYGILALYVPGAYVLYTYMMKQRRKVLYPTNKANKANKPKKNN